MKKKKTRGGEGDKKKDGNHQNVIKYAALRMVFEASKNKFVVEG